VVSNGEVWNGRGTNAGMVQFLQFFSRSATCANGL
jgi:hypothetical protein